MEKNNYTIYSVGGAHNPPVYVTSQHPDPYPGNPGYPMMPASSGTAGMANNNNNNNNIGFGEQPGFSGFGVPPPGGDGSDGYPPMGFHKPSDTKSTSSKESGSKHSEAGGEVGSIKALDFSNKSIRRAFIRKVYGIVSVQLLMTTSIIALLSFHKGAKEYVQRSPRLPLFSYIASIVILLVIACCDGVRRKSPHNLILLGLFTLTYGLVIGVISSQYNLKIVALAAIVTTLITLGLTAFAFQTKVDFTAFGGVLFCCVMIMFIFGIIMLFLPHIPLIKNVFACLGALLFSLYLIYDTQLMIGGKHKFSISPEEYVCAALNIYMDIIMIFLYLLRILDWRQ